MTGAQTHPIAGLLRAAKVEPSFQPQKSLRSHLGVFGRHFCEFWRCSAVSNIQMRKSHYNLYTGALSTSDFNSGM